MPLVFASTPADLMTAENFPQFPAVERAALHLKQTGSPVIKGRGHEKCFKVRAL